jgi:four helix bundle protein
MMNFGYLPFEKLNAYQEARKLLAAVREASISESRLRDQALRAATSACLNISEGAGRRGSADKARV